jgi:hypothetical protein
MSMNRMSRVITFRLPTAPGWKVQFNMNDQHFTLMQWFIAGRLSQKWIGVAPGAS